ncbi:MAG: hypothetical protein ACP6IS_07915 [Candidatus Asgardarchaeia archaeon]
MSRDRVTSIFKDVLLEIVAQEKKNISRKQKYRDAYKLTDEIVSKLISIFNELYNMSSEVDITEVLRGMIDDFKLKG